MKTLLLILASIATFLIPIQGLLLLMILFIFLDTCFGIYSTVKRKGWKSFRSTKLFNLVVKSFFYLASIILAFLVDTYVFQSKLFGWINRWQQERKLQQLKPERNEPADSIPPAAVGYGHWQRW